MGQDFAFIEESRSGNVSDHVTGTEARIGTEKCWKPFVDIGIDETVDAAFRDAGEVGEGDGRVVERVRERRAVEIASADYLR